MKIVAGLGSVDDYKILAEAGADEVFCGFVPFEWNKKYGNLMPLNRREVLYYHVQIGSLSEMQILKKMEEVYKVPVTVTFNALYYTEQQYHEIEKMIISLMQIGFSRFIIADIGLLLYLRQRGINCKIYISGEMGEVNRLTFSFLKLYQIDRMIFHRQNTIADMASCISNNQKDEQLANIEYEAFFLNEKCQFHGGFCNSLHCDELTHMCKVPYQLVPMHAKEKIQTKVIFDEEADIDVTGATGCGLCALRNLKEAGITHLKVVGRGNFAECMAQDIRMIRQAIQLLDEKGINDQISMERLLGGKCSHNCYYKHLTD